MRPERLERRGCGMRKLTEGSSLVEDGASVGGDAVDHVAHYFFGHKPDS